MPNTALDEESLGDQMDDLRHVLAQLDACRASIDGLQTEAGDLQRQGYTDGVRLHERIGKLAAQNERSRRKAQELLDTFRRRADEVARFNKQHEAVRKSYEDAVGSKLGRKIDSAEPGSKQASADLKKFHKQHLEKLQRELGELNPAGHALLRLVPPGISATKFEQDLEKVNKQVNQLVEKIAARESSADTRLIRSGNFPEMFQATLAWVSDTEAVLDRQRPASAEYQVVKSQLNEARLLTKMIADRNPSLEALNELGFDLIDQAGQQDAERIRKDLHNLNARFSMLQAGGNKRVALLNDVLQVAKRFRDQYEPVLAWLDGAEKRVAGLESASIEPVQIQKDIEEHKKINAEIERHASDVEALKKSGRQLIRVSTPTDAATVQERVDNIEAYFEELKRAAKERTERLESATPVAERFTEARTKLQQLVPPLEVALRSHRLSKPNAEAEVEKLESQLAEMEPVVHSLRQTGDELRRFLGDEASDRLSDALDKELNRYGQVAEELARRAQKFGSTRQRAKHTADSLDHWQAWIDKQINQQMDDMASAPQISSQVDLLQSELARQRAFRDVLGLRRPEIQEALQEARKLMRESPTRAVAGKPIRERVDGVKASLAALESVSSERLDRLESAMPLASEFAHTQLALDEWLDEAERSMYEANLLKLGVEQLRDMHAENKLPDRLMLEQALDDRKPLLEKLNKLGPPLSQLVHDADARTIRETMRHMNKRYAAVRNFVKGRLFDLDQILSQTTEFGEQLDVIADNMASTGEFIRRLDPISAHPDKLRDQLDDNQSIQSELEQRLQSLKKLKTSAEDLIRTAMGAEEKEEAQERVNFEPYRAVVQIQERVDDLLEQWSGLQSATKDRQAALDKALAAAESFWTTVSDLQSQLGHLKERVLTAEPPAALPADIEAQLGDLGQLRDRLAAWQVALDGCRRECAELSQLVDAPERPEVAQPLDEAESMAGELQIKLDSREQKLGQQLERAKVFQEQLVQLLEWIQREEAAFDRLGVVGSEVAAVQTQLGELKGLKAEVEPKHADVERLNQTAYELTRDTLPESRAAVEAPLNDVNARWDNLVDSINERKHRLQTTLLNLGELELALEEILNWIEKTDRALDGVRLLHGDPKGIEVELAKLKMIQCDLASHRASVDTALENGAVPHGDEAQGRLHAQLELMNAEWQGLLAKAKEKQVKLESALHEALIYDEDLQDMFRFLTDTETKLLTNQPSGGLPDSAKEQLRQFLDLYNSFSGVQAGIDRLQHEGKGLLGRTSDAAAYRLQADLLSLAQRWENVRERAGERKTRLESALTTVEAFHSDLAKFITWLTATEKALNQLKPVSRLVQRVTEQISAHTRLKKEVSSKREEISRLDRHGSGLKLFSQKQDVILIKNLLASIHHRWERIVSRSSERTRHLDHGFKEAQRFRDLWAGLLAWLRDQLAALDEDQSVGNSADTIRAQVEKHREFQRALGAKNPAFDQARRMGKAVKEKAPAVDHAELERMVGELKAAWNLVCTRSLERQRSLEDALLHSGQYKEALSALLEWLHRVEPELAGETTAVHGDLDTVANLCDNHQHFQEELDRRRHAVDFVRAAANELMTKSDEDSSQIHDQLVDLTALWQRVVDLTAARAARLLDARRQAEQFSQSARALLDYFAGVEHGLRHLGASPDDEEDATMQALIAEHAATHADLEGHRPQLDACLQLGHEILAKAHPDAAPTIKQWLTILKARYNELLSWSEQRGGKLREGLVSLQQRRRVLDELLSWLTGAEATLRAWLDSTSLADLGASPAAPPGGLRTPDAIEAALREHADFEAEVSKRQPEYEDVTRHAKRRPPPKDTERWRSAGRSTPTQAARSSSGRGGSARRQPEPAPPLFRNSKVNQLQSKWNRVWAMTMERRKKLQSSLEYIREVERMKHFDFDDWRRRYATWMNHNKTRVMDFFRRTDTDHDGRVTRAEFIDGILESKYMRPLYRKFPTSRLEMEKVADIFDNDGDGFIDYREFVAALRPESEHAKTLTESERIHDEVKRQAEHCTCNHRYKINKIGDGKYKFGDSQKLRLVRILRSTVMVRVGGGWVALDEFLVKNDPCRAKGRTNLEVNPRLAEQQAPPARSLPRSASSSTASSTQSGPTTRRPAARPASTRASTSAASSRTNSRPTSRPSSRPPSRAGSEAPEDGSRPARRGPIGRGASNGASSGRR